MIAVLISIQVIELACIVLLGALYVRAANVKSVKQLWQIFVRPKENNILFDAAGYPSIQLIIETVSKELAVPVIDIVGKSRVRHIANARQIACYVCCSNSNRDSNSLRTIGSYFDIHYSTVINSFNMVSDRISIYPDYKKQVSKIIDKVFKYQIKPVY